MAAVDCPACGAARGSPCILRTEADRATASGRLLVHGARRIAWQEYRARNGVDIHAQPDGPRGGTLHPHSERATTAVLALVEGAVATGDHVRVPDLRRAIDVLTADGWIVE